MNLSQIFENPFKILTWWSFSFSGLPLFQKEVRPRLFFPHQRNNRNFPRQGEIGAVSLLWLVYYTLQLLEIQYPKMVKHEKRYILIVGASVDVLFRIWFGKGDI